MLLLWVREMRVGVNSHVQDNQQAGAGEGLQLIFSRYDVAEDVPLPGFYFCCEGPGGLEGHRRVVERGSRKDFLPGCSCRRKCI